MIVQARSLSAALIVFFGIAALLPAQREPSGESPDAGVEEMRKERMRKAEASEVSEKEAEEWANLTPEERLERGTRRGSAALCRFVAACRPAKLLPGQSGTLLVTALLQGQAVLPAPAPVELLTTAGRVPIEVGQLAVRPAEPGSTATAYQGRPVYENYAVFELPVRMAGDAKIGDKHVLALDLKFDLYDGKSAQALGRFIERVSTEVVVGEALDPVVEGGRETEQAAPAVKVEPIGAAPASGASRPSSAIGGEAAEPAAETPSSAPEPAPASPQMPPMVGDESGLPLLPIAGGGVLLVGILLLLLRRR